MCICNALKSIVYWLLGQENKDVRCSERGTDIVFEPFVTTVANYIILSRVNEK